MYSKNGGEAIDDCDFPITTNTDAWNVLKGMVDNVYQMTDNADIDEITNLESIFKAFRSWCNEKQSETNNERKDNLSGESFQTKFNGCKRQNLP